MVDDRFLDDKLNERRMEDAFRRLRLPEGKADLCSNDYLGVVRDGLLEKRVGGKDAHGSGGSRLLAGNYALAQATEQQLTAFHASPAGLLYNSGYDANVGVLSCIPQRGDVVLYDALSHASIRDGIRLSFARAFGFAHNDCADLEKKLAAMRAKGEGTTMQAKGDRATIFVVTESVFSMDGDFAPLEDMVTLCRRYDAHLIVDEAHATGVVGPAGEGLVQELGLQQECFARIHTFGKAVGCHGAVVLGSNRLCDYLINFSRAFIYTTALPPSSVRAIAAAYDLFPHMHDQRRRLQELINRFRQAAIGYERLRSSTPIQIVIVPGNAEVRALAERLQQAGLDIRPIQYPTVPRGSERLRIVIHSFNTSDEIDRLTALLQKQR